MNEQNPYNRNDNYPDDRQQPPYQQQQQPYQPPYQQQQPYQPPYQQQPPYQPPYQQPPYRQQPYYQQLPGRQPYYGYAQRQPGGGAAKAFAVVSFVAGICSMMIVILTLSLYTYSSASMFSMSVVYSFIWAIPGLLFGILSLAKKTRLFVLGLLGVIFNGALVLELIISATMLP